MKKVYYMLLAAIFFILASCSNLPVNNGEVGFTLDSEVIGHALNVAKDVAGKDYPVTVEVNIHGRIEKSISRVVKSKDDVANLNFAIDIPKNLPSDVEVLITIDKSVVLYRGVTKNVKPELINDAVEVVLNQVFEVKKPKILTASNGVPTKIFRGDDFEVYAVAEDGSSYPDFISVSFSYQPSDYSPESGIYEETITLTGSRRKSVKFTDFYNSEFHAIGLNASVHNNFLPPKTGTSPAQLKSHPYEASNSYLIVHPIWGVRVVKDIASIPADYTAWNDTTTYGSFLSNINATDVCFGSDSYVYAVSGNTSSVSNFVQRFNYNFTRNTYSNGGEAGYGGDYGYHTFEKGYGTPSVIVMDNDNDKKYLIGRKDEKNVIYQVPAESGIGYPKYTLPFDENQPMDACVYDDKLYIVTLKTTKIDEYNTYEEHYLKVYNLGYPCEEIKSINLRTLLPRYADSITDYNRYSSDFARSYVTTGKLDILTWEDKVYVLYNEIGTAYTYSTPTTNAVSRGAVIEIDPSTLSVSHIIGWTDRPSGTFVSTRENDYYGTLHARSPRMSPESPESMSGFFGPQRFVAVKPKKLVIQDSGEFVYVDADDGKIKGKRVNRIVEVNLETFTLDKVDPFSVEYHPQKPETPESGVTLNFYTKERAGGSSFNSNVNGATFALEQ